MLLIDTSIWINIFRDKSGDFGTKVNKIIDRRDYYLPIFAWMELLQGCKSEAEWHNLNQYLAVQKYVVPDYSTIWLDTARLYFELRRKGITIRSNIDCAIALCAIENNLLLLHSDRDFEQIAKYTVLKAKKVTL